VLLSEEDVREIELIVLLTQAHAATNQVMTPRPVCQAVVSQSQALESKVLQGPISAISAGKVRGSGPFALNAEPEPGVRFGQP
jgi:hypothetical protein